MRSLKSVHAALIKSTPRRIDQNLSFSRDGRDPVVLASPRRERFVFSSPYLPKRYFQAWNTHMPRKKLLTCLLVTLLPLVFWLWRSNVALRHEVASLRAESANFSNSTASAISAPDKARSAVEDEIAQSERRELLILRGRVSQLSRELSEATAVVKKSPERSAATEATNSDDTVLFSASITNTVPLGNTLALGGWSVEGTRTFLLLTPSLPDAGAAGHILITPRIVRAPDSLWSDYGWADAKSPARRSGLAGVLEPGELEALLSALKQRSEARIVPGTPSDAVLGGHVGFGFATAEDNEAAGALMGVEVYPRPSPISGSVELELQPTPLTEKTPIHKSLKRLAAGGKS